MAIPQMMRPRSGPPEGRHYVHLKKKCLNHGKRINQDTGTRVRDTSNLYLFDEGVKYWTNIVGLAHVVMYLVGP